MKTGRTFWMPPLVVAMSTVAFAAAPIQLPVDEIDGEIIQPKPEPGENISEIRVERTACLGACPQDEIVLRADGTAQYQGKLFTEKTGTYTSRVNTGDWQKLAAIFDAQFFELKDFDSVAPPDKPSFITTAVRNGESKKVVNYGDVAPQLWNLQMVIRGVASQIKWKKVAMKGKSGVWGNATLSMIGGAAPPPGMRIKPNLSPMQNTPIVVETPDGKEIARATTDKDGDFEIALPPGDYFLFPGAHKDGENAMPFIRSRQPVTVKANRWTQAQVVSTVAMP